MPYTGFTSRVLDLSPSIYYKMGASGSGENDQIGSNNLTFVGSPVRQQAGMVAGDLATVFDAVNDYASPGNGEAFDLTHGFSLMFLIRPDGTTSNFETYYEVWGSGAGEETNMELTWRGSDERLHYWPGAKLIADVTSSGGVGQWYLVTLTFEDNGGGTRSVKAYLNGHFSNGWTETSPPNLTRNMNLGRKLSGANQYFNGAVSELILWNNRVLTWREISNLWQSIKAEVNDTWEPLRHLNIDPNLSDFSEAPYASTPHSAALNVGAGLDVRWFGTDPLPSYDFQRTPLVNKGGVNAQVNSTRAWALENQPSNNSDDRRIVLRISQNGVNSESEISDPFWLPGDLFIGYRATWRASDQRVQFFVSYDNGETWDQIGSDKTMSGSISSIREAGDIWIGHDQWVAFAQQDMFVDRVEVYDGNGDLIANPIFSEYGQHSRVGDTINDTFPDDLGNVWTLTAAVSGGAPDPILEIVGLNSLVTMFQADLVLGDDFEQSGFAVHVMDAGLILGDNSVENVILVGQANADLILGGTFPQAFVHQMSGGLSFGSDFQVIPPEVVAGIGSVWNIGLAGMGFMLSTLDEEVPFEYRSYEIQAIPQQRPQIDDQDEPGEQTLFPWWSRAQHSWHEGAGQEIFDSPFSSRYKYCSGRGLDPWDQGELKLLKDTQELIALAGISDVHLLGAENALFYTHDGNVTRDEDPDTAGVDTLADHDGVPINSITSDGEVLYAAFSGGSLGIKSTPLVGTLAWSDVNAQTDVDLIGFVKGRLIGAKGPALYEYDLAVTTEPEAFHTDVASNWLWTAITESGPAIYVSGYAGERSEIFALRLTAQDIPFASVATVGAPVSVWTAPDGERVLSVKGYTGQQLLIGTTEGVRIGTVIPGSGELQVSGIITERREDHPRPLNVQNFEPQGDYAWFTWTNYDGTYTGLGRIHLGNLGWSGDLMFTGQGEVRNVVTYAGRRYFTVFDDPDTSVVKEHPTDLVETAQLNLCEIRFGTTELKVLRYFDVRGRGQGFYAVSIGIDGGPLQSVLNPQSLAKFRESVVNLEGGRFKVQFNIDRDPTDATQQFILTEWRMRSEPRSKGRFRYFVPIMIYDHLLNAAEIEVGKVGHALEQLEILIELYRTGRDTLFQRLGTGIPGGPSPTLVIMEDLRFKSFTPPQGARGFGGVALAILREVR